MASQPQGVGIGLRREHFAAIEASTRPVDWLEIIPENYVGHGGRVRRHLERCRERWPVIAHGVSLSLGGPDPLPVDYVAELKQLLDELEAPYYTDHLCYATIGGVNFYDLLPVPFTEEAVRHCAGRIRELADRLERPVAVENVSYYAVMPGARMSEGQFVSAVVQEAAVACCSTSTTSTSTRATTARIRWPPCSRCRWRRPGRSTSRVTSRRATG